MTSLLWHRYLISRAWFPKQCIIYVQCSQKISLHHKNRPNISPDDKNRKPLVTMYPYWSSQYLPQRVLDFDHWWKFWDCYWAETYFFFTNVHVEISKLCPACQYFASLIMTNENRVSHFPTTQLPFQHSVNSITFQSEPQHTKWSIDLCWQ